MYIYSKGLKDVMGLKHQIQDTGSPGGGRGKEKGEDNTALQLYW